MEDPARNVGTEGSVADAPRIGPYRIVKELGRGGMGTVYLCADTAVGDRLVALKVVHDPRAGGAELIERFRREIRNLGVLRHPNIVQVLYAGEHDGHPYFVMEYVRGRELNKWLEEVATLPEPERIANIVRLMAKVCRGVAHAHVNGTIHRDLKPQNILVREDGEPLVLDFGIAKHREDTTLTASQATPGTPSHMAPEQIDQTPVLKEDLVDVWALGTILYQALTRERPFRGHSLASVSYQIVHGRPIGLRKLDGLVPPSLEDLVLKCLEKDPRKRPQSAQALAESLERSLTDVVHSARRRRTRAAVLVTAALIVVAALVLRPWNWWKHGPDFQKLQAVVEEIGGTAVRPSDRMVPIPSYQVRLRMRFGAEAAGATLEAALVAEEGGDTLDRGLLALGADGLHEAVLRVPPARQKTGLRASIDLFANGERLALQVPTVAFVPESPTQPESRIEIAPSRPVEAPLPQPVSESRTESRVESPASSRATPGPHLPEVWGRISAVEGVKKLESVVALKPGDGEIEVLVESALDSHVKWKWKLRLLDSSGRPVVESDLNPLIGPRTLQGTLRLGPLLKGRTLTAEFVITDAEGNTQSQKVGSPQFVESLEGAPKPLVTLKIAGREDVVLELDRKLAPDAVEAFLEHVRRGDYDACALHEVKKNQHVKAGVFDEHLAPKRGPPAPLPPEWGRTKTKYPKMAVAMTGQAEFQILMQNTPSLGIMIAGPIEIGRVVKGEDVLVAISEEPVAPSGEFKFAPVKPVVILKAIVEGEIGETR